MKKIILILALIFSCCLTAQTKIYEIQNKGKGVISELTPANLLLIKDDFAKIAISNVTGLGDALDLKANDTDVVKLTGNQTIDDYKTFTSTITATTSNYDDFAVNAFSEAGNGVIAKSNTSTALVAESVSAPAAKFKTTGGSRIVSFQYGFDDKAYIDINGGYVKSTVPASNILLAGGGDLAQNTAFNKNFGTTAGTVAEGNDSRINNGQTAFGWGNHAGLYPTYNGTGASGTWGINISGTASSATNWGTWTRNDSEFTGVNTFLMAYNTTNFAWQPIASSSTKSFLGLGSNAYTSTPYLPLSGGTLTGAVTATSYTATSLPVFENNAAASSLAVGQFYRTSTGVLMVKF